MDTKRIFAPALALLTLLAFPLRGATRESVPAQASFQVSNLVFEQAMLVNMVNTAIADGGTINNFSAGPDAGVLSVSIHNSGSQAAVCYLIPVVRQGGDGRYNCYNGTVATGPLLQTKALIQPGQTIVANAASLEVVSGGEYNGGFCQNLQNLVNGNFGGSNSIGANNSVGGNGGNGIAAVESVVQQILQLQLSVCLEVANSGGSVVAGAGDDACTSIAIFARPPSVQSDEARIVYPSDITLSTPLPTFLWTPTLYNGSSLGLRYELVLSRSANGNPWYSAQVPNGQTFYQYQAMDRVLQAGQSYYFHVVTLNSAGQPVGGQSGQGWNQPQAVFTYNPAGTFGSGLVVLNQLDALILKNASPSVLKALAGMQLEGVSPMLTLNDPDAAALLAKPSEIKSISVEKF